MKVDRTDRAILQVLQEHGRISNVELAGKVGLSPTPCLRRVRKLESAGVIKGYAAMLDRAKLDMPILVLAFVRLTSDSADNARVFEDAVRRLPNVMECCVVAGSYDYVLRIVARDLEAYEAFLKRQVSTIPNLATIDSTIVLKQAFDRVSIPL